MGAALKLLTAVLVLVDGAQDGDDLLVGGQGDGTGNLSAGTLGGLNDLLGGLIDDGVIVSLQSDAHFLHVCHGDVLLFIQCCLCAREVTLYGSKVCHASVCIAFWA